MTDPNPLRSPPPPEVPLRQAPLVRVLAQVRFPPIMAVRQKDFVAPFQEAIRAAYPVLRPELTRSVVFGPGGAAGGEQVAWRFLDAAADWRVTLAEDFVALETTAYESRSDFVERLRMVLTALREHVQPEVIDRLGLRYIDRIEGDAVEHMPSLVRHEMLGLGTTTLVQDARHLLHEAVFQTDEGRLLARWGWLPADATLDEAAIEPLPRRSWVLDLDMAHERTIAFDVEATVALARRYAERIYTVFRWAVTTEFLRRYGGNA